MQKLALTPILFWIATAAVAYDVKNVKLGAKETELQRALPSAHCKPLEWKSKAADRRCDDSRVALGGVETKVTFYLKKDVVEAFDVRFDSRDLDRLLKFLKSRYGAPQSESKDTIEPKGQKPREVYKALWESGGERAVLTAQIAKRRGSLLVYRGDFEEEIYRVR
jgi:hypothetical protein